MRHIKSSRWLLCTIATLPITYCTAAAAQSAPASPPTQGLGEIVVTAQKTSSDLQKTPIAISVLSQRDLERADIRSVLDLDKQVPGLSIMNGGAYPLNITIRGVGYDGLQNNSAQPGVAFVENGVYIASPLGVNSSFLDLGQLEVLRGPQGTVNGQNADGGAINVTTQLPQLGVFHLGAEGSYGSYNYDRVRGTTNIPIGDTLALRFAVQHEGHDGWLYAPNQPKQHIGNENSWTGRASLLFKPTPRLSITLWGELSNLNSNGLDIRNPLDPIGDPRATSNDFPTPSKTRSRIAAATVAYDFDFAVLKLISSYQHARADNYDSGDLLTRAEALSVYGVKDQEYPYVRDDKSYTEELNLAGKTGKLDWIIGGFFLRTNELQEIFLTQQSSAVPIPYTPNFNPTPAQEGYLFGAGLGFESVDYSQRTSYAGYGQATYHFTDALRLTGGLRYSRDSYESNTSVFYSTPVLLVSKFHELTGRAVIEYEPVAASTVYASFSTGVKPGGTNLNPGALVVPESFVHEFVRAYELGLKSELLDHMLRLNISAYYNDYRNLQSESEDPLPFDGGITNIPKSRIYGVEGEATVILPDGFRIAGNAAYMQSKVESHFAALDPIVAFNVDRASGGKYVGLDVPNRAGAFEDLYGHHLARVPNFSASGTLSKATAVADGVLNMGLQANYRSWFWARVFNVASVDRVGPQFTMNFNARYEPGHGPWYVELQVTNLTGSNSVASRFPDSFGVGGVYDYILPPRQVIGRIGVRF